MRQTVVGVFERYSEAQRAAEKLRDSGFGDSVYVTEQYDDIASSSGTSGSGTSTSAADRPQDEGMFASVRNFFSSIFGSDDDPEVGAYAEAVRRGGAVVKVEVEEDAEVDAARAALVQAGAIDLDEREAEWGTTNMTRSTSASLDDDLPAGSTYRTGETMGSTTSTQRSFDDDTDLPASQQQEVVPVVREELQVGKRTVTTGGVRVYTRTVETPVSESVSLRSERAVVDRRTVDRPASQADLDALGESTIEVRETTEQPVVAKEARVVEEVRVGKVVEHRTEEIRDTVRNTEVSVESMPSERQDTDTSLSSDEDFRTHFHSRLASSGGRYEDYEPAYLYGSGLRSDTRYSGRSWDEIEPDLRRDWERSNPGSAWERFKSAVRHGWDRMTS